MRAEPILLAASAIAIAAIPAAALGEGVTEVLGFTAILSAGLLALFLPEEVTTQTLLEGLDYAKFVYRTRGVKFTIRQLTLYCFYQIKGSK